MVDLGIYNEKDVVVKTPVRLQLIKVGEDLIQVVDEESGWSLVGFKVVDGKINVIRYTSVGNPEVFKVNTKGQLVEVSE